MQSSEFGHSCKPGFVILIHSELKKGSQIPLFTQDDPQSGYSFARTVTYTE